LAMGGLSPARQIRSYQNKRSVLWQKMYYMI
jgi:hypothetical protein